MAAHPSMTHARDAAEARAPLTPHAPALLGPLQVCDNFKMTPLHWASVGAHKEIAELLIAAGSRKNKIDRARATPLETAKIQLKRLQDGIDHFGNECAARPRAHYNSIPPSRSRPVARTCLLDGGTPDAATLTSYHSFRARPPRYKGTDKAKQISKFSSYVEYMESLPGIKKKE